VTSSQDIDVRVLLADYEGAGRRALAGVLSSMTGVVLAGEVAERAELAAALRLARADVLVIDDRLLRDGGRALADLERQAPELRILVLGVDDDPAFATRAQHLGAEAWIAKDRAGEQLPALLQTR